MSGDPNSARDDVLGALSLIEATITGMPDCPDKLRLAFASSALRRANEKMRGEPELELHERIANISAPGGVGAPAGAPLSAGPTASRGTREEAGAENVIPIGHSIRVPIDPADAYPLGSYKHPDAGRIA